MYRLFIATQNCDRTIGVLPDQRYRLGQNMRAVRRFLGCFFLVIGVFGFFQQPISGLVFISWGVLLLPFTNQFAANRGWHLNLWKRLGIAFIGFVLIGLTTPRSQTQQIAGSPTPSPVPTTTTSPLPSSSAPTNVKQPTIPSPISKETSFSAMVEKKGLDFSYEVPGRVEETAQSIIVTYTRTWECGAEATVEIARQEWQAVFDLASKTWTDKVKELSNCLGNANQEWIDYSTTPSQFSIETSDSKTVLRADAQDTDGSIIVKDSLVVRYNKQ
jgi:hypothetical protein